ncbi:hypothetical protein [Ekhidna sp.]|uniref:hypothetical protein n=1 Tax=Ekhidna sp. TaxID=2608089 RepID=UPI00351315D9
MMSWVITKQFVFTLLLVTYTLASGQMMIEKPVFISSDTFASSMRAEVLLRMNEKADLTMTEKRRGWYQRKISRRFMEIKHQPADDFNIYLSIGQLITPNIKTSMEVSLNYMGQVNIRNLIALRRKEK